MDRVGIGQDSHRFAPKKPLILAGFKVAETGGLAGNSDSDVILHSLANALSSAIGAHSLSTWADKMLDAGITDSRQYVNHVFQKVKSERYKVANVSISIEAKKPYISLDVSERMKENIAVLLQINKKQVGITFTSGEGLTSFGRGLGMQSICTVLLSK